MLITSTHEWRERRERPSVYQLANTIIHSVWLVGSAK